MKKEIVEMLEAIKVEIQEIEKVEYDRDFTTRNYFDGISDALVSIDKAIAEVKK